MSFISEFPNLKKLLFSFEGRISRAEWWIGVLIVTVVGSALKFLVTGDFLPRSLGRPPNPILMLIHAVTIVANTALTVKRFNDRDYWWWLGFGLGAFSIFVLILEGLFSARSIIGMPHVALLFGSIIMAVLIDNGFLRGTKGPNDFGPDPLEKYRRLKRQANS